jgi:hypothetical protein
MLWAEKGTEGKVPAGRYVLKQAHEEAQSIERFDIFDGE